MKEKNRIFITGGSGFIGSNLVKHFNRLGHPVTLLGGDLQDFDSLKNQLSAFLNSSEQKNNYPTTIIHLAGLSAPPICEKNPPAAFIANTTGTSLLLEALRQIVNLNHYPHIIFASTAHVYDTPEDEGLITEQTPIKIKNVYGETKIQAESILKDFSERNRVKITILRLFNHAHISQSKDFFISSLFHQIKELPPNNNKVMVGNLNLYRDIGTIPDLISAFEFALDQDKQKELFDIFNICSGQPQFLADIAKSMALYLNRQGIEFVTDSSRLRSNEPKKIAGSFSKMKSTFGWEPSNVEIKKFLLDLD